LVAVAPDVAGGESARQDLGPRGIGRELGLAGLDAYLETRYVTRPA